MIRLPLTPAQASLIGPNIRSNKPLVLADHDATALLHVLLDMACELKERCAEQEDLVRRFASNLNAAKKIMESDASNRLIQSHAQQIQNLSLAMQKLGFTREHVTALMMGERRFPLNGPESEGGDQ